MAPEPQDAEAGRARMPMGGRSVSALIPNALTICALCAGLTAVRFALLDRWEHAVAAIMVAAILDGLDGRMARLLNATSKFGAELDSLSDFVSFGAAPALIVFLWSADGAGGIGWAAALFYAVCCALRLARFNTMLADPSPPAWARYYVTGVPAPAGAFLAVLPLMVEFAFPGVGLDDPWACTAALVVVGALMVSRIPTFAMKQMRIPRALTVPALVLVALLVGALATAPWATLVATGVAYLASIPFSVLRQRKAARATATGDSQAQAGA
ncbi:MAG: CDP-alcohol phosphatidyltransferase family protein [Alphaproteobacteria bacterium]